MSRDSLNTNKKRSYSTQVNPNMSSPSSGPFMSGRKFEQVFRLIPEGDDNHIRTALYNMLALLCLIIVLGISVAVYFVLQSFLKPIGWALLFGAFLHPFKRKLTKAIYEWIDTIYIPKSTKDQYNKSFLLTLLYSPLLFLAISFEKIGESILSYWRYILIFFGLISTIFVAHRFKLIAMTYLIATYLYGMFVQSFDFWLNLFSSTYVFGLLVAFLISICFIEYESSTLKYLSYFIWFILMCNASAYMSSVYRTQSLIFLGFAIVYLSGLFYDLKIKQNKVQTAHEFDPNKELNTLQKDTQKSKTGQTPTNWDSKAYIVILFWACFFVEFYKWIFLLIPISLIIASVRKIGFHFGLWDFIQQAYVDGYNSQTIQQTVKRFNYIFINTPIKGIYEIFLALDRLIIAAIRDSIDTATTIILLIFTFVLIITLTLFVSFQIYQESAHLVNVAHSALNTTLTENQWFQPSSEIGKSMDSVMESGYHAGRDWIATQFGNIDSPKSKDISKLEGQILALWDNLYDKMIQKKGSLLGQMNDTNVDTENITNSMLLNKGQLPFTNPVLLKHNWDNIVESLTSLGSAHKDGIVTLLKNNLETLNSVLATLWLFVKSNINLVFLLISNFFSIIFGGGTALFNFILSWIIFLSTLVYFLSSSGEQYKPVQLFTQFMPTGSDDSNNPLAYNDLKSDIKENQSLSQEIKLTSLNSQAFQAKLTPPSSLSLANEAKQNIEESSNGAANRIALAIQEAISGVFAATLKMTAFYGLYTWLLHKLFGVGVVYIPTVLASIFAAVPFVGTYMACLPATLELWIITQSIFIPVLFFVLHLIPKFFVDATIYQEIKGGGHPYFTGLSIVGGMYVFGLEGALIGPMLLCCLFVGLKIFGAYMHED